VHAAPGEEGIFLEVIEVWFKQDARIRLFLGDAVGAQMAAEEELGCDLVAEWGGGKVRVPVVLCAGLQHEALWCD
jgi:hypothetical protein